MPSRGASTAWADIFKNILDQPDIFEFDLAGFFNSYKLRALHQALEEDGGIPADVNNFLFRMNENLPLPPKGEAIRRDDPELAPRSVFPPRGVPGRLQVQYAREAMFSRRTKTGATRVAHWAHTPLKGVPQGVN
jgi:hypothetical protein